MLIVMQGDRCLHSVRRVEGVEDRINIIMTFDTPGAVFPVEKELDSYLYSKTSTPTFDPNYQEDNPAIAERGVLAENEEILQILLAGGASLTLRDPWYDSTAIGWADFLSPL